MQHSAQWTSGVIVHCQSCCHINDSWQVAHVHVSVIKQYNLVHVKRNVRRIISV